MTTEKLTIASLMLDGLCLAALLIGYRHLAGTTLRAPWWWSLLAIVSLAARDAVRLYAAPPGLALESHLRYAAAVTTFCPVMAVLGAKRPQDRGWQFIVLSLLVVLLLPGLEALLRRPQAPLQLHGARQWFLAILIALGCFNWLPTRYWSACLAFTSGQLLLLAPFLPLLNRVSDWPPLVEPAASLGSSLLIAAAALLVLIEAMRRRTWPASMDRWWFDFRDAFGAVWALRVLERMNAAATMYGWPVRLTWNGFVSDHRGTIEQVDVAPIPPAMERAFRMLLRRFVGPQWLSPGESPSAQQKSPGDEPGL